MRTIEAMQRQLLGLIGRAVVKSISAATKCQTVDVSLIAGEPKWMIDDGVVSRIDLDIRRTGINELGNSITLWRRDGPIMVSFDDLWSAITHGGQ
ncbi:hypothetical protein EBP73_13435 [Escherichia coli O5]|nr:hypothetical protein [Escherichia coli O5]